jgi:hypothetical protein
MSGKMFDLGPIGLNVTRTVRKFREERRIGYAALSRRLADLGREIPPLGLRRIENGERRVDADDLVALALALDVSPLALLLPREHGSQLVADGDQWSWMAIWLWGMGLRPLQGDTPSFVRDSNPLGWAQMELAAADIASGGTFSSVISAVQEQDK